MPSSLVAPQYTGQDIDALIQEYRVAAKQMQEWRDRRRCCYNELRFQITDLQIERQKIYGLEQALQQQFNMLDHHYNKTVQAQPQQLLPTELVVSKTIHLHVTDSTKQTINKNRKPQGRPSRKKRHLRSQHTTTQPKRRALKRFRATVSR